MVTRNKERPYRRFGSWLCERRELEGLTQLEASEKLRALDPNRKGVSSQTWSRWENGHRKPPRTKIDSVAKVVKANPKEARRRAGYNASERRVRRDRSDLVASMLRILAGGSSIRGKILNLYALYASYYRKEESTVNIKLMLEIARTFDVLKNVSEQVRAVTFERIERLCKEAENLPQVIFPVEKAVLVLSKKGFAPVMIGTTIGIENVDEEGLIRWDTYTVTELKVRGNKVHAQLEYEIRGADYDGGDYR